MQVEEQVHGTVHVQPKGIGWVERVGEDDVGSAHSNGNATGEEDDVDGYEIHEGEGGNAQKYHGFIIVKRSVQDATRVGHVQEHDHDKVEDDERDGENGVVVFAQQFDVGWKVEQD